MIDSVYYTMEKGGLCLELEFFRYPGHADLNPGLGLVLGFRTDGN
jgi:hypothetical protein